MYACYIDFKKCFDRIDRAELYKKLQGLGIPFEICKILHDIYSGLKAHVRSGDCLFEKFLAEIGLPQGCIFSPIGFILFAFDLGLCFTHKGFGFGEAFIKFLMYADDLVILCESAEELQQAINNLAQYCSQNHLSINTKKSKVMIFGKGRVARHKKFTIEGKPLEEVKSYTYLGFKFSPQLSFSDHLSMVNTKARSRIGLLFNRIPLRSLQLEVVLKIFDVYVLPIYRYGVAIWLSGCAKRSLEEADATHLKYLKRYLGISQRSNNAITYYLTGCEPLSIRLKKMKHYCTKNLQFPAEFHGVQLSFLASNSTQEEEFNVLEKIPTWFWLSRAIQRLPSDPCYRQKICQELYDHKHLELCETNTFHHKVLESCICKICGLDMESYHERFCKGDRAIIQNSYEQGFKSMVVLLSPLKCDQTSCLRCPVIKLKRLDTTKKSTPLKTRSGRTIKSNEKYYGKIWTH